jgi:CubicO group peptidase (beta-lactamase class C family)
MKRLRQAFLLLLLLGAALLAIACVLYPPTYVWRVLVWQDADADDYERFPMRRVEPAPGAVPLPRRLQTERVTAAWQQAGGELPMEDALAKLGTQAFLVLRDGAVIHESYANGASAESWVTSFSVAKSMLSVLMGIAVQEQRIASLDDPVTRYLPELRRRDARFERITLRHLLDMSSGTHYAEFPFLNGDDAKTYYHPDLRRLALEQTRIEAAPGQRFHYNNFHPLLLGMVLERATGMPVAKYLETRLWQPAGMSGPASWSLDSETSGFEKMESGVNARAEDFARFGWLMLQGGRAGERQVVPPAWLERSTWPHAVPDGYYTGTPWTGGDAKRFYTAMWWGQLRGDGERDFAARGNHGQLVFVSPRNGIVIVRHGWRYGMPPQEWFERARRMADALGG